VGPGEEGFPVNIGGMQLPPNPAEDELLQIADEFQQEQLVEHGMVDVVMEEQLPLPPPNQDQMVPEPEPQANNFHLHVGFTLMPDIQWGPFFSNWEERKDKLDPVKAWDSIISQGNSENFYAKIHVNWISFFMSLLALVDQFGWTKDFLCSRSTTFLDDNNGIITLPIPKNCSTKPSNNTPLCIA
jgi:hypothetical protein